MAAVASYRPEAFNSLPNLATASHRFTDLDALSKVSGPIRDLFLNHGVQERFGVVLLHKHSDIKPTERLVEYGHTASPWTVGDDTDHTVSKYDGAIVPRSFRLMDGDFVPYEFGYLHEEQPTSGGSGDANFIREYGQFLADHQLDGVIGLRDLDQHDASVNVEVTEGKSNIMLPRGSVPQNMLIPAVWIYGLDEDDSCKCASYCCRNRDLSHTGEQDHTCRDVGQR